MKEKTIENRIKKEVKPEMIFQKIDVFMRLTDYDKMAFFDLVNAICLGSKTFVTQNELILGVKDKIQSRIANLKIIEPKQLEMEFKGKELKSIMIGTSDFGKSYIG